MTTQSIIVYRNPLEAAIWESMMGGGFIVLAAVLLLGVIWVLAYIGADKFRRSVLKSTTYYGRKHTAEMWTAWIVTIAAAIGMHFYNIYG